MTAAEIIITINGVTHKFTTGDVEAIRDLPWSERKQLIDLLENIQQAEYVKAVEPKDSSDDAKFNSTTGTAKLPIESAQSRHQHTSNQGASQSSKPPQLDSQVVASEKDVDDLMNRLILEQQSKHQPVPDKSSVVKLLLIVFTVIIVVAFIF